MSILEALGDLWRKRSFQTTLGAAECADRVRQATSRTGMFRSLQTSKVLLGEAEGGNIWLQRRFLPSLLGGLVVLRAKLSELNGVTKVECVTGLTPRRLVGLILLEGIIGWVLFLWLRSLLSVGIERGLEPIDAAIGVTGFILLPAVGIGLLVFFSRQARKDGELLFKFLENLLRHN